MAGNDDEGDFADYAAGALARLRRVAFLLCQDWHRADDLTQNALTRLYTHWRRARTVENLDAYVGTILLNAFLSEQRTAWWRRTSVRPEPGESLPRAADDDGAHVEELLDLRAALRTLAPRKRAVVVLRYYCDYSVEQTAQILGCSAGTVKSQTSKALAQLKDQLEPDDNLTEPPARSPYRVGPSVPGRTQ